jgi:hypothetical protein
MRKKKVEPANLENYVVYLHYRNDKPNHVFYVGSGRPRKPYKKTKDSRNDYWFNIVNAYGYTIKVILTELSKSVSEALEGSLIEQYKSIGMCETNFGIPTGLNSYIMSNKTKEKLSLAKIGNKSKSRKVTNGEVCFYSARKASEFYNLSIDRVAGLICINGKAAGFNWEYIDD